MTELDETVCKQMSSLVELLTTSGKPTLNPEIMKKFKKICRTSDLYVEHAFVLLMTQLEVDHAEVRLSTYQMMEELFVRSHMFRELMLADFDTFLELTTGTDRKKPLPLPKTTAQNMKNNVFKSVQIWYEKFGAAYKKLELGYEFLKSFQKVDFSRIQADLELERRQREENERKIEEARNEKLRKVNQEITESEVEMQLSLTEVENGIQLLMPHPDDFFIPVHEDPGSSPSKIQCNSCDGNFKKDTKQEHTHINKNISSDDTFTDNVECYSSVPAQTQCFTDGANSGLDEHLTTSQSSTDGAYSSKDNTLTQTKNSSDGANSGKDISKTQTKTLTDCANSGIDKNLTQTQCSTNGANLGIENSTAADTCSNDEGIDRSVASSDDEGESNDSDNDMEDMENGGINKHHGIIDPTFSLTVTVGPVSTSLQETEDNTDLIQGVRDQYRLIKTKYMPMVKRWTQVLEENHATKEKKLQVSELKGKLEEAMKKCVELEISSFSHRKRPDSESDDDDDDFEEVPEKEGYEEDIPEHVKLEAEMASTSKSTKSSKSKKTAEKKEKRKKKRTLNASTKKIKMMASELMMSQRLLDQDDLDSALLRSRPHKSSHPAHLSKHSSDEDLPLFHPGKQSSSPAAVVVSHRRNHSKQTTPCSSPSTAPSNDSSQCSSSTADTTRSNRKTVRDVSDVDDGARKSSLLEKAPVVSYGLDIEHWENPEDIKAPVKNKFDGASRFWVAEKDESETVGCSEEVASLTRRTMTYVGDFEPVKWKCRAPVGEGKLCERMDRVKCPFHGKVIGRDENGMPTNPEDFSRNNKTTASSDSDTQSSKGKGKSLKSKRGKGKAKKRKYGNLTDIREKHDDGRKRLEAKIFNKSTLRRVNKVLDNAAMKKLSEKFGNQFNYSLK